MSSLRVVIVSDFADINGGAAKVAVTSARGLADAGILVTFVCAIAPTSTSLNHANIETRCLDVASVWNRKNPFAAAAQGIWNEDARTALEETLEPLPQNNTVVHFHQWTKALSPSVLLAPQRRGLPAVASLHDYFIVCPNGAYYRFPQAVPCRLMPMSAACIAAPCDSRSYAYKAVRVLRQRATAKALAQAGSTLSILSVSPFADQVIAPFIPKSHARFVIRSPIEVSKAPTVQVAANKEFVCVGRLTEEKGVLQLAKLARDAGYRVAFVGDGPLLTELKKFGTSIRCTGWLSRDALEDEWRRVRTLVFPSAWYETGGLVVLEALARGVPVIVSRTTAAAEFVADGQNGYIIDAGDTAALSTRMLDLLDDSIAARMGAEAYRRYWSDPQTADLHTRNLIVMYEAMLKAHARGHRAIA